MSWKLTGFTEIGELGTGAQGRVVLARRDGTGPAGPVVAIKYMTPRDGARVPSEREAGILKAVEDPHVARLYDLVHGPAGAAALVMEAVEGVPLGVVLEHNGELPPEVALLVLKGSLGGLAAAHDAGVVHRDYKPSNVIVQGDGDSKLIDFGVAGPAGARSRSGTPAYMAPEQWEGDAATPATDVYAATCVFFECLTGHPPFSGGSALELWTQHGTEPVPLEEVPPPVRPLVEHGMAKDPAGRPEGAAAFAAELEAVATAAYGPDWERRARLALAALALALASLFPEARATASGSTTLASTALGGTRWRRIAGTRRNRRLTALAAAAALLIGAGGAALVLAADGKDRTDAIDTVGRKPATPPSPPPPTTRGDGQNGGRPPAGRPPGSGGPANPGAESGDPGNPPFVPAGNPVTRPIVDGPRRGTGGPPKLITDPNGGPKRGTDGGGPGGGGKQGPVIDDPIILDPVIGDPVIGPCTGDDCPCTGENCPCTGEDCPCTGEDCPCTGDDCPCTGEDCPCTGADCPCTGADCPCTGEECPCTGDGCPCQGDGCGGCSEAGCPGGDCGEDPSCPGSGGSTQVPGRQPVTVVPAQPVVVVPAQPVPVPVGPQPISAQPVVTQPVQAQPVPAGGVSGHPVFVRPIAAPPVPAQPVPARPVPAQPVPAGPVSARPVPARPVPARPVVRPVAARPVSVRPAVPARPVRPVVRRVVPAVPVVVKPAKPVTPRAGVSTPSDEPG